MINPSNFISDLVTRISEAGQSLTGIDFNSSVDIKTLCEHLISEKGEAIGIALAKEILSRYKESNMKEKLDFFQLLLNDFGTDNIAIENAFKEWKKNDQVSSRAFHLSTEPKSIELISRLNRVKGATSEIVDMRSDLIGFLKSNPELKALDDDFKHLLTSWFNRGFLELKSIDWSTSAEILERIIKYEAVHEIQGWSDLRRRVVEPDRRLFAYFHPAMINEPLIFVEVALVNETPKAIQPILAAERESLDPEKANTAAFYSISNCQPGLRGISFGNFLIKKAAMELKQEIPTIKNLLTLSPVPGFGKWLNQEITSKSSSLNKAQLDFIKKLQDENQLPKAKNDISTLREIAACYLVNARTSKGGIYDPVARFHLGNGACLKNIHANANLGKNSEGHWKDWAVMVNYEYKLQDIEKNHEAFINDNIVIHSSEVQSLVKKGMRQT